MQPVRHILFYCEDDDEDQELFRLALEDLNWSEPVRFYRDVPALIAALQNPPPVPSIVFLDIHLPGENGFDALKQIRASDTFENLKVVMLSTSSDAESIRKAEELGASGYLVKSTAYPEFVSLLKSVLSYADGAFYHALSKGEFYSA